MAQNDLLKRYLDAGLAFTAMTQARAEAIITDMVKAGEVQAEHAREAAQDLLERSRRNTDRLIDAVREEIRTQISNLGLATKEDLARLERRIDAMAGSGRAPAAKAPAKRASKAAKSG